MQHLFYLNATFKTAPAVIQSYIEILQKYNNKIVI